MKLLHFSVIDSMPDFPALPLPDYARLVGAFRASLMKSENHILRYSPEGHPIFGAYVDSPSNEMVTWGILALGEWLQNRDCTWIQSTFTDFFNEKIDLFNNTPGKIYSEHWYLFYVNSLSGAVACTLFPDRADILSMLQRSADTMHATALKLNYDYNQQGYDYAAREPFTRKEAYRQPDSIAGYAYNMLFAALRAGKKEYYSESVNAMRLYEAFDTNPWYEIPNGSAGMFAAAWLHAHGEPMDMQKIAGWVFDSERGPLQSGKWGKEEVDGLMMGWRGYTREYAASAAYSMETLMPMQFVLPSVRYVPALAEAVSKYMRCALGNFRLFYAEGTEPLYETRPDSDHNIPYERFDILRDGHTPAACGDFYGQRSVYGAGYLYWAEALVRRTNDSEIIALDLSLTDWLSAEKYPVFLLRNPYDTEKTVSFTPAPVWEKVRPELYRGGCLCAKMAVLDTEAEAVPVSGGVTLTLPARSTRIAAVIPCGAAVSEENGFIKCNGVELIKAN